MGSVVETKLAESLAETVTCKEQEEKKAATLEKADDGQKSKQEADQVKINLSKMDAEIIPEEGSANKNAKEVSHKDTEVKSNSEKQEVLAEKPAEEKRVEKVETASNKCANEEIK